MGETGSVFFVDLRNELSSRTRKFSLVSCRLKKKQYTMKTRWKEIAGDMSEPKLREIFKSTLKKPVLDEKDTTTESDSKQKMILW